MPNFAYRAVTTDGKSSKGIIDAVDQSTAIYMLKQRGLLPIEVLRDKDVANSFKRSRKASIRDIAIFCRQFAAIITAGVTILAAIDMLKNQTSNKILKNSLSRIFEDLQKGNSLSQSMKANNVFPDLMISMIEAGEISGTLESTMQRIAVHYEKENKVKQKLKSAMTYPIVLCIVSIALVAFMVYFVLPNFLSILNDSGVEMPALTKAVVAVTDFARDRWYIILSSIIGFIIIFKRLTSRGAGRLLYHKFLLKLPVMGKVLLKIAESKFTRTLGNLLASGISLIPALEAAIEVVGNAPMEDAIKDTINYVKKRSGLAVSLKSVKIFEPMVVYMVEIGEDTGTLDQMLIKTSDFFDEDVEAGLTQLMTLIEPAMLVIMGSIVGIIIISVLLPMLSMMDTIGV